MRITLRSDGEELLDRLSRSSERIAAERMELSRGLGLDVVEDVVGSHPVETGRSRAGWESAAGALAGGGSGSGEGWGELEQEEQRTEARLINEVEYEPILEYGTSQRPGTFVVRNALERVRAGSVGIRFREFVQRIFGD